MIWILLIIIVQRWKIPNDIMKHNIVDESDETNYMENGQAISECEIEISYVIATFLSRCRYAPRYGFDDSLHYTEVKQVGTKIGKDFINQHFTRLSQCLKEGTCVSLLEWTSLEYSLSWETTTATNEPMKCTWKSSAGDLITRPVSIIP